MAESALDLWRRWFAWSGDPWDRDEVYQSCIFCGHDKLQHEPDCIWVAAKKLVERPESTEGE
jgi:hypothetical protein